MQARTPLATGATCFPFEFPVNIFTPTTIPHSCWPEARNAKSEINHNSNWNNLVLAAEQTTKSPISLFWHGFLKQNLASCAQCKRLKKRVSSTTGPMQCVSQPQYHRVTVHGTMNLSIWNTSAVSTESFDKIIVGGKETVGTRDWGLFWNNLTNLNINEEKKCFRDEFSPKLLNRGLLKISDWCLYHPLFFPGKPNFSCRHWNCTDFFF